jgi:hypothetical protein
MSNGADADRAAKLTIFEALAVGNVKPSLCARALTHCAGHAYQLGMLTAAVPIVVSLFYALVVPEPLWQRMMTVVVLGLAPSSIVLMTGALVGAILAMGSMSVDPANALFRRLMPPLGRAVLAGSAYCLGMAVTATRRAAKWIGRLSVAGWRAWEDLCWAGCDRFRMAAHAWSRAIAHAIVCCANRSISSFRRASAATAFTVLCGSRTALKILVCGGCIIADRLEVLGCMINVLGSMAWMAATSPIRLVARVLLRLTQSRPANVANGCHHGNARGTRSMPRPVPKIAIGEVHEDPSRPPRCQPGRTLPAAPINSLLYSAST